MYICIHPLCMTVAMSTEHRFRHFFPSTFSTSISLNNTSPTESTVCVKWRVFICNVTSIVVHNSEESLMKERIKLETFCFRQNLLSKIMDVEKKS